MALIIVNTRVARRLHWHRRALDYRFVAESFRQYRFLFAIGGARLAKNTTAAASIADHGDWCAWYLRANVRQAGVPNFRLDEDYLARYFQWSNRVLLRGQIAYHRQTFHELAHADQGLKKIAEFLFAATVLACALHLYFKSERYLLLTVVLPAIATACMGLRSHCEFERIIDNSLEILTRLKTSVRKFQEERCQTARLPSVCFRTCIQQAVQAMGDELAKWTVILKAKDVEIP